MKKLIEELRHRNVFRVGIAYVIAGWLFVQIADIVTESFAAPEWVMRILIIFLLIGLPIALFLAWAFELTPDGVKKAEDVPANAPKDPRSGQLLNRTTIAALVVAVAWLGWDEIADRSTASSIDSAVVADKSIAVLPFADFSPDNEQGWFADGLTDEILNALARTVDLRVASRTSSFAYRDSELDVPAIAARLGVAHILEGSVRRAGERLRVTAQLIRTADDVHLWSDTFDGTTKDSIEIQEQIALKIANALETAMDPIELERMISSGTRSIEAWEMHLRAESLLFADVVDTAENALRMIELLEQAVKIDPGFADAQLSIANFWSAYLNPTQTVYFNEPVTMAEAKRRFDESITMAEQHARSEVSRTEYQSLRAYMNLRIADVVAARKRLTELRPGDFFIWAQYGYAQIHAGDYVGARDSLLRAREMINADNSGTLVFSFLHRLDVAPAMLMAEAAVRRVDAGPSTLYQAHRVFLYAGEVERAARVAELHNQRSVDESANLMVNVRQACAESRVADAEAYYAGVEMIQSGANAANRWLYLKTLGRDDEARDFLTPYDAPDGFSSLAGFLNYTSFEPADYPNFNEVLLAQGIDRPPATEIPFACKRDES
jgi:TolB-like protein